MTSVSESSAKHRGMAGVNKIELRPQLHLLPACGVWAVWHVPGLQHALLLFRMFALPLLGHHMKDKLGTLLTFSAHLSNIFGPVACVVATAPDRTAMRTAPRRSADSGWRWGLCNQVHKP